MLALQQAALAAVVQTARPLASGPGDADCTSGGSPGLLGLGRLLLVEVVQAPEEQERQPPQAEQGRLPPQDRKIGSRSRPAAPRGPLE